MPWKCVAETVKLSNLDPIFRTVISEFHFTPWPSCPIERHLMDYGSLQVTRELMRGEYSDSNVIYLYVVINTADWSGTTWQNLRMVHTGSARSYFALGYIHENNSTARPRGDWFLWDDNFIQHTTEGLVDFSWDCFCGFPFGVSILSRTYCVIKPSLCQHFRWNYPNSYLRLIFKRRTVELTSRFWFVKMYTRSHVES